MPFELSEVSYHHPDAVALTAAAQAYYRRIYRGEDTNPIDATEFAPPDGGFLVGRLDGEPVAMGGWRFYPGPSPLGSGRPAELRRMFVRADVRGRGYASRLLAALESAAGAAGADHLILETGQPQTEALAFYARAGYRPIPAFGHWAGTPGAIHLGRTL